MWRDVIQLDVDDLANCSSSAAALAARASQPSHDSQLVGVEQFRQAVSITCWVLGLPG